MLKKKKKKPHIKLVDNDSHKTGHEQLPKIKKEICHITNNMKTDIYRIGELLVKAKKILKHGGFEAWIDDNFEFSHQQANNFMNVYRHCLGRPELVKTIKPSILYQITSRSFPEDLREHILENGKNMKRIKGKEFRKVYDRFKKGELDLDSSEIKKLFKQNKKNAVNKAYAKEIDEHISKLNKLKDNIILKISKFTWPVHPETQEVDIDGEHLKNINRLIAEIIDEVKALKPEQCAQDTKDLKAAA